MMHKMGLFDQPFQSIKSGRKTVEIRLNDEKRRKVSIGDIIEFVKVPEQGETLKVEVLDFKRYNSFKEIYEDISAEDMDAEERTVDEMVKNTYKIYSPEQEKVWGTLAITIKLVN